MTTGRFAPSPTGRMHLGNIFGALLSWLSAKSRGGRWLLRIEDLDPQRSRREYGELIMDDLQWLGLEWDGMPIYQSNRSDIYSAYLERLRQQGVVYECHRTRADLLATMAPHESDGRVVVHREPLPAPPQEGGRPGVSGETGSSGTAGSAGTSGPAALRVEVPHRRVSITDGHYGPLTVDLYEQVGDFVVRRKDGAYAYQLAVVVDDALTGVTEVVRGRDLLLSAPQQTFLAKLLELPAPRYYHFPLLTNRAGQRLSKRDKSMDMSVLRYRHSAQEIIGYLGHLAGLLPKPTPMTPQQLLPLFSWDKVPREDITVK
ncbi:MAG: tRNA glutamyl-Q(34) synthetase GluQRS [Prevotella sp.]|nr:tRNA glutamyl-Q(34) synthetase GluQRS [Prevotella sp.]